MRRSTIRRDLAVFALFSGLMLPFGFCVHLVAELAGVGAGSDFVARHLYMILATAIGIAIFISAVSTHAGVNAARELVGLLPDRGRGARFFAVSLATQFAIALGTQAGEGLIIPAPDLVVTLLAALAAASIGALVCASVAKRLIAIVCALFEFVTRAAQPPQRRVPQPSPRHPAHAFAASVLSRPPPTR
jgi:hypothetical protein